MASPKTVYFSTSQKPKAPTTFMFSQFHQAPICDANGKEYFCNEQYYQERKAEFIQKFRCKKKANPKHEDTTSANLRRKIMAEKKSALRCAELTRDFIMEGNAAEDWAKEKDKVLYEVNYLKFTQNCDERDWLLDTHNAELVEASKEDDDCGIGFAAKDAEAKRRQWGKNRLGRAMERVREQINKEMDKDPWKFTNERQDNGHRLSDKYKLGKTPNRARGATNIRPRSQFEINQARSSNSAPTFSKDTMDRLQLLSGTADGSLPSADEDGSTRFLKRLHRPAKSVDVVGSVTENVGRLVTPSTTEMLSRQSTYQVAEWPQPKGRFSRATREAKDAVDDDNAGRLFQVPSRKISFSDMLRGDTSSSARKITKLPSGVDWGRSRNLSMATAGAHNDDDCDSVESFHIDEGSPAMQAVISAVTATKAEAREAEDEEISEFKIDDLPAI